MDLGSNYPVPLKPIEETKQMKLKWIAAKKQECKSKIVHYNQMIEDMIKGKIPEIERQILAVQQELDQLENHEQFLLNSIDIDVNSNVKGGI